MNRDLTVSGIWKKKCQALKSKTSIMLKFITFIVFLFYSSLTIGQTCSISGEIIGLGSGVRVFCETNYKIDTTMTSNGKFHFEVSSNPSVVSLIIVDYTGRVRKTDRLLVYVQPGNINLLVSNPDSVFDVKVNGPIYTEEYANKLWWPMIQSERVINDLKRSFNKKGNDTSGYFMQLSKLVADSYKIPRSYIKGNPNSFLCVQALFMMGGGDPTIPDKLKELIDLFNSLADDVKNSPDGLEYASLLKRRQEAMNKIH